MTYYRKIKYPICLIMKYTILINGILQLSKVSVQNLPQIFDCDACEGCITCMCILLILIKP